MLSFSAFPLVLAAAFFPANLAAVTWVLSTPPALQRGLTYLAGALVSRGGLRVS
jgi:hypothetical protein